MKINWGTGVVIAFALFITFILYFVFKVQSDSTYDHELVETDYYKQEQKINSNLDKKANVEGLSELIKIQKNKEGITITFPDELKADAINGKVFLYRPSDQSLDFDIPISMTDHTLLIPRQKLIGGLWNITLDFECEGRSYFYKKPFYY